MHTQEAIQMMSRCKAEIENLRAHIERLTPKAEAYDNLVTVLRLLPQANRASSEDLAWTLSRRIEELKAEAAAEAEKENGSASGQ